MSDNNYQQPLNFKKVSKILETGLHQYEPVWTPEDNPEDEIKITEDTMWIPMCQKGTENPDLLTTEERNTIEESLERFYRLKIAQQFKKNQFCKECQVECFNEQLEMLDFMPISEMFSGNTQEEEI